MTKFLRWAFDYNTPMWVGFLVGALALFSLLMWGATVATLVDAGMYWRGFVVLLTPPLLLARIVWIEYRERDDEDHD